MEDKRTAFRGRFSTVMPADLLQTLEASGRSAEVCFDTALGRAKVWLADGRILDARMGHHRHESAIFCLLSVNEGVFEVEFKPVKVENKVSCSVHQLVEQRNLRAQQWQQLVQRAPALDAIPKFASGHDALSAGDSEIAGLVDGRRTVLDIIDESGCDAIDALRRLADLADRGVLRVTSESSRPFTSMPSAPALATSHGREESIPPPSESAPTTRRLGTGYSVAPGEVTVVPGVSTSSRPPIPAPGEPTGDSRPPLRTVPRTPTTYRGLGAVLQVPKPLVGGHHVVADVPDSGWDPQSDGWPEVPPRRPAAAEPADGERLTPTRILNVDRPHDARLIAPGGPGSTPESAPPRAEIGGQQSSSPPAPSGSSYPPRSFTPPGIAPVRNAAPSTTAPTRTRRTTSTVPGLFAAPAPRADSSVILPPKPSDLSEQPADGELAPENDGRAAEVGLVRNVPVTGSPAAPEVDSRTDYGSAPEIILGASVTLEALGLSEELIAADVPRTPRPPPRQAIGDGERFVGRYEVLCRIGRGGMASVYLCRVTTEAGFRRLFALKVLHAAISTKSDASALFLQEASLLGWLSHPNIVGVVDAAIYQEQPYLVMDYVEGCSLHDLLKRAPELRTTRMVIAIVLDALAGLHAAHTATDEDGTPLGIVHCDISPDNLLVGSNGVCRLSDFGIARVRESSTRSGVTRGKPAYLSPEQIRQQPIDGRSDVFSMGVVLYNALTGIKVFEGDSTEAVLAAVLHVEVPRPSEVGLRPPRCLDRICLRALERDPKRRYPSAQQMLLELRETAIQFDLLALPSEVAAWVDAAAGEELRMRRLACLDASRRSKEARERPATPSELPPPLPTAVPTLPPPDSGAPATEVLSQTIVLRPRRIRTQRIAVAAGAVAVALALVTIAWPDVFTRLFTTDQGAYSTSSTRDAPATMPETPSNAIPSLSPPTQRLEPLPARSPWESPTPDVPPSSSQSSTPEASARPPTPRQTPDLH